MTMQIRSIILYSHGGDVREISFKLGAVNIITGRSLTGKSAITDIIDYCLGRSTFVIAEGVIRDTVAWYAVIFDFGNGTEVLVAKPAPAQNAASQSAAYLQVGSSLKPPPLPELSPNTNDQGVIAELSARLGIAPNLHVPKPGQTREELEATIRHTVFYLFQVQGLIANKDLLFYRQQEQFMPQAIKDTLPYFLGITNPARLAIEQELRLARRRLKIAERNLEEAESVTVDQLLRGQGLVAEAQQAGILPAETVGTSPEDTLNLLRTVLAWKPSAPLGVGEDKVTELRTRVDESRERLKRSQKQIQATEVFERDSLAYASEAGQQVLRLQSIKLFEGSDTAHRCPVCSSELATEVPTAVAINDSLQRLGSDLTQVEAERPRLREYIDSLKVERETARQELVEAEFALESTVAEDEAAEELRTANTRAARVAGRVSLYLETLRLTSGDDLLQSAVRDANADVTRLESLLDGDTEDLLASALNIIATDMTAWAEKLELEHKSPYRLDITNLTVAIDRPGRPVPMHRIGGGKNWLGCHLVSLLALHKYFVEANCPVPGFLVLDQPTQVYFVSPQQYKSLSGSTNDTVDSDADLDAVRRMFELLWTVCDELTGKFQVIVLEHANLPEERYQAALVEDPWSGIGDHALIPEAWKSTGGPPKGS